MNVVIVAGGLGSRLAPLTNHIPKFLVNIGKQTGFVEQIRYWAQYKPHTVTVIVHSAYAELVQAYFNLYFRDVKASLFDRLSMMDVEFIVKTVDVANGSAHAIMTTCEHLHGQPTLFTWCDVLPGEPFDVTLLHTGGAFAFTNYDHPNRYDLTGAAHERTVGLREDGRGGIFGVYYVSTFSPKHFEDGQDFVEILHQYDVCGFVQEVKIGSIIDWGDKPKLERVRATADQAREFNSVVMHDGLVLKSALNNQGETLIKREIAWYDTLEEQSVQARRPQHWTNSDKKSFVMTRVKGVPIYQLWPKLDLEGRQLVLKRVFEQLDLLHQHKVPVDRELVLSDVKAEARDKLIARYREIKPMIDAFGHVHTVNGWQIGTSVDVENVIEQLYSRLYAHYASTDEYSLIHGDLQMSNSMIDPDTLEVTLIDPRGYFGQTVTYGLPDYDYAKLYYSLSGYDLFNYSSTFNILSLKNGKLEFVLPKPDVTGLEGIIANRIWYWHQLWLAVCWIGLAQYIKNDPVKSVCAHYHGLVIADKVMAECFDPFKP